MTENKEGKQRILLVIREKNVFLLLYIVLYKGHIGSQKYLWLASNKS